MLRHHRRGRRNVPDVRRRGRREWQVAIKVLEVVNRGPVNLVG